MNPENPPRKRVAYGLPADMRSVLDTGLEMQRIVSEGVNPDGSLTPAAVRALLKFRGVRLSELAEKCGYSDQYFHLVINRERRDVVVEDQVAAAIGMDADRIFARRREPAA